MKTFKQFREECGCKDKERKGKKKKSGNVEVMPTINDGQKGMVTKTTNESVFAGNYAIVISEEGQMFREWIKNIRSINNTRRTSLLNDEVSEAS